MLCPEYEHALRLRQEFPIYSLCSHLLVVSQAWRTRTPILALDGGLGWERRADKNTSKQKNRLASERVERCKNYSVLTEEACLEPVVMTITALDSIVIILATSPGQSSIVCY